jgi:hypothetical protein
MFIRSIGVGAIRPRRSAASGSSDPAAESQASAQDDRQTAREVLSHGLSPSLSTCTDVTMGGRLQAISGGLHRRQVGASIGGRPRSCQGKA